MTRAAIPAEIRRAVLVEAGHRCAIPRCGETELDVHHIVPWESCQKHEYSNLIALCVICHRRVHKGEIDRKSLFQYKAALSSSSGPMAQIGFDSPVIEVRRRISESSEASQGRPGYTFEFDYPDFPGPAQRVISKNVEAWGNELLVRFRTNNFWGGDSEETFGNDNEGGLSGLSHRLKGVYRVVRNDAGVISLEYRLHCYYSGAAHGGIETRVQNFLVNPFRPVTILDLLAPDKSIEDLAAFVRSRLRAREYYNEEWMMGGTEPKEENYSRFLIYNYGFEFIFEEYQIASYADGRQRLFVDFYELRDIFDSELMLRLQDHDNYDY